MSYLMTTSHSCGPDALCFVLKDRDRNEIYSLMNWFNTCDWRDNMKDYIGSHFKVLDHFEIPHKLIDFKDFKNCKHPIICLLHNYPAKIPSWINAILYQHWVVVERVDNKNVFFHDGSGRIACYDIETFQEWFYNGSPNCAYVVGEGELNINRLEKFWDTLVTYFIKAYNFIFGE